MIRITDIQKCLVGVLDYTDKDVDGIWGPKSDRVFNFVIRTDSTKKLVGDGTWSHLDVRIDGNDIIMENVKVTAFGGSADSGDNGITASGYSTILHPNFNGCSLPLRRDFVHDKRHGYVLRGSPLPAKIPWHTKVVFYDQKTSKSLECELVELGPAKQTGNGGDLMVYPARYFEPNATANNFGPRLMNIRIIGGAAYVT